MTNKQTIDGVSRVLLEFLCRSLIAETEYQERINARDQLRALLDAPAEPKPTGLSQGWNLTRKYDGFVVGHQSAAYPPDKKAIERAERDGYVWVPFLVPATQPQGEVERLRAELKELRDSMSFRTSLIGRTIAERDTLHAQLAERDVLLREVVDLDPRGEFLGWQLDGKIDAILSTSAEPNP